MYLPATRNYREGFLLFSFVLVLKGKKFLNVCVNTDLHLENSFATNSSEAFLECGETGI